MTDQKKTQEQIWNEVGEQFEAMGESLAAAVKATTQDEKVREDFKKLQAELKSTTAQISQKVKKSKDSGESPDLDDEANRLSEISGQLGDHAAAAGQGLAHDAKTHLFGALSSVQAGLSQMVDDLKNKGEEPS